MIAISAEVNTKAGSMSNRLRISSSQGICRFCMKGIRSPKPMSTRAAIAIQTSSCVSPTLRLPIIFPAISWLGETEVTTISMVRFSFSSTSACSRYPPLDMTAITKRMLTTRGMMILMLSFSPTMRVPSNDFWMKWLPSLRRRALGRTSPASRFVRIRELISVRISLVSGLLK